MDSKLLKLNSLQYLRGLSAIAVLLFHIEGGIEDYWQAKNYISLFSWGHFGVEMFFCLSGFVIAYSGYLRKKKLLDFMFTRLARIYPVYIFSTALFILIIIIVPQDAFNSSPNLSIEKLINSFFLVLVIAVYYIFMLAGHYIMKWFFIFFFHQSHIDLKKSLKINYFVMPFLLEL